MQHQPANLGAPQQVLDTVKLVRLIGDAEAAWNAQVQQRQAHFVEHLEQARADADTTRLEPTGTPAVHVEFEGAWIIIYGLSSLAEAVAIGLKQSYLTSTSRVVVCDADGFVESSYDDANGFWFDHRKVSAE
jgi:hypothetical protein